jgi:hypothetical protein
LTGASGFASRYRGWHLGLLGKRLALFRNIHIRLLEWHTERLHNLTISANRRRNIRAVFGVAISSRTTHG